MLELQLEAKGLAVRVQSFQVQRQVLTGLSSSCGQVGSSEISGIHRPRLHPGLPSESCLVCPGPLEVCKIEEVCSRPVQFAGSTRDLPSYIFASGHLSAEFRSGSCDRGDLRETESECHHQSPVEFMVSAMFTSLPVPSRCLRFGEP